MHEWPILLEQQQLESCVVIQNVSNSQEIDTNIIVKKLPIRVKQSSDTKVAETFNTIEKLIRINLELISKICEPREQVLIQKSYEELLKHAEDGSIIGPLYTYNSTCVDKIVHNVSDNHRTLSRVVDEILQEQGGESC